PKCGARVFERRHLQLTSPFFFFFQAEDGIRDKLVTGVQTCALPISSRPARWPRSPASSRCSRTSSSARASSRCGSASARTTRERSEERRVGKECSSRWEPHQ